MNIYIPTYGRAGRLDLGFFHWISDSVTLCVREEEVNEYRAAYGRSALRNYMVLKGVRNIAETRQQICERVKDVAWAMVDDDISRFYYKENPTQYGGLRAATSKEVRAYLRSAYDRVLTHERRGYVCAIGVPDRVTLARPHEGDITGAPLRQFVVLNKRAARAAKYTLPILSDIEVSIRWMMIGESTVFNLGKLGQASPHTAKKASDGGCGVYREKNEGYYARSAQQMAKLFPKYVRVVNGKPRVAWSKLRGAL